MSEQTGLWAKFWPLARAGHAIGGALKHSAQDGLLHNVAALPGAFTGAILRDLQGPQRPRAMVAPVAPPSVAPSAPSYREISNPDLINALDKDRLAGRPGLRLFNRYPRDDDPMDPFY